MIARTFKIRRWKLMFLFSFDKYDEGRVLDALVWASAPDSIISHVSENIRAGRLDEGFCFSSPSLRRSVVGIGKTSTGPEFLDSTVHEIFHTAQDIAREDNLDPYGEDIAYLAGDISHEVSDIVCEMSCPKCRGD